MSTVMSNSIVTIGKDLTLIPINGELRIQDVLLAKRLGFKRPRVIRELIQRHEAKLATFGQCSTVRRCYKNSTGAKVTVNEYYLNQQQAMFICMKSETENAFDVQADIVRVYDAYLNGELVRANQQPPKAPVIDPYRQHLLRDTQLTNSKSVNRRLIISGGKAAIVAYNTVNCVVQSGKTPKQWKQIGKSSQLMAKQIRSAKEVIRVKAPPVACGMSLTDSLVSDGANTAESISIGKDAQPIFKRILALGLTPAELLM